MKDKNQKYLTITILVWANLVSALLMGKIFMAVAWFEIDKWLYYPTLILISIHFLLIIFSFYKRFFKIISVFNIVIIILGFIYGVHFAGLDEMFITYRKLSITLIITILLLSGDLIKNYIVAQQKKTKYR